MVFAQEVPPVEVTVDAPTDPLTIALTAAAVGVALLSLLVTWRQGVIIRNIETREHDWQAADRQSAHLQVVPVKETRPQTVHGATTKYRTEVWIRLTNTGRAPARDVTWSVDNEGILLDRVDRLEVLHPGEQFDLYTALSMADAPEVEFVVRWTDDVSSHETRRLLSL